MAENSPDPNERVPISLRKVSKQFGKVRAVDEVSLDIQRGELFGLIGHNGAGKSTLFRMMLGLLGVTSGEILINGVSVSGRGARAVRRSIGYLPENVVLYDNLNAYETLRFFSRLKNVAEDDAARVLDLVGLTGAAKRRVREYSKGMRQRLGFAQALLGSPQLLFLDEPTNGLDPEAIRAFYAILRKLRDQGVTVIITSHILAEIQQRVDRLAILAGGRLVALGTVGELREKLELPLVFEVRVPAAEAAELAAGLQTVAVHEVHSEADGDTVTVQAEVLRTRKMEGFAVLAGFAGTVLDFNVREPSLEDVFFGFAD